MSHIVVVYYSRTGKTRWAAGKLAGMLGADLEEIHESSNRDGLLGWLGGVKDSLKKKQADLISKHCTQGRTMVIVGMPVWADGPPPAVRAYLQGVDLAGLAVCAFTTSGGGKGDKCFAAAAELVPQGLAKTLHLGKVHPQKSPDKTVAKLQEWAASLGDLPVGEEPASPG